MNKESIKQVKNVTFLGIVFDEFLTWWDHLNLVSKKIIKCAAIISKIRHFTNLCLNLNLIYHVFVFPYLTYVNPSLGSAYKSHIQKLIKLKRTVLMTLKSCSSHTGPIFNELKVLNARNLNEYLTNSFRF